ncbi:MAG: ABC transporter ATP-binding protein [Proteobacteria bacterium]|nr:ABC transporter ATP-binding protein [Pseudomonadota bacterium]
MTDPAAPVLQVTNLTVHFGGVTALDRVSFEARAGEILAVIGPNGAGKTSLLNCINGFYRATSGSIVYRGQELMGRKTHDIARLGVARVFQGLQTYAGMTTLDNLMTGRHLAFTHGILGAYFYFWSRARQEELANRRRVEEVIKFLEIEPIRKKHVGELSYGLRKRVDFGRALAMEPDLLLLDEPMAGMNLEEKEDMARFFLDVSEQRGTTMLLIEHDMGVVMDIADRIVVLDFGRLIAEGRPADIGRDPAVLAAYLGQEAG